MKDYSAECLEHYYHPKHCGTLNAAADNVGTAQVGSVSNGEVVRLQIAVADDGKIEQACFKAQGSCATIAAASFVCDWLQNKSLEDLDKLTVEVIVAALELPSVKIHCALLALDALQGAVADYAQKSG